MLVFNAPDPTPVCTCPECAVRRHGTVIDRYVALFGVSREEAAIWLDWEWLTLRATAVAHLAERYQVDDAAAALLVLRHAARSPEMIQ